MAVSTVLPSKSSIAPAAEVVASFIEVHEQGRKLGRGPRRPEARSPPVRRSRWSRRQGRPWACRGARSSRRQGLEARRASIFGRSEHDDVGLVEVNIDSSKVCLSCQTHSVAAGKLDVSMASTVLEVHHRDVVVGLDEAPPDTRVPVETNLDHRETRVKTVPGSL